MFWLNSRAINSHPVQFYDGSKTDYKYDFEFNKFNESGRNDSAFNSLELIYFMTVP